MAAALLLLPLIASCGTTAAAPAPTVTVTVTQPAVTVTAAPPTTPVSAMPLALGQTATTSSGSKVTVFAHKKGVEPQDGNPEAIDVKVCLPAEAPASAGSDRPLIGDSPWSLYDAESRTYTSASSTWDHPAAQPAYPVQQTVNWGDCVRGWVIIEGQAATVMTKVRYTVDSSILEWKLP